MFEPIVFIIKTILKIFLLCCVKHLDVAHFVCVPSAYIPMLFHKTVFKVIVGSVGTILNFTSMLMCLRLIFLCFHQADLKRVVAPLNLIF